MRRLILVMAVSLAACATPKYVATTAYDGTYTGDMDKMLSGDPKICSGTSHKSLQVMNGIATIVGESDTRMGQVTPEGQVSMSGKLGTFPRIMAASVTGQFANKGFHGTSTVGNTVICTYEWTLKKT